MSSEIMLETSRRQYLFLIIKSLVWTGEDQISDENRGKDGHKFTFRRSRL